MKKQDLIEEYIQRARERIPQKYTTEEMNEIIKDENLDSVTFLKNTNERPEFAVIINEKTNDSQEKFYEIIETGEKGIEIDLLYYYDISKANGDIISRLRNIKSRMSEL